MSKKRLYNVDVDWDDPYDRYVGHGERRGAPRTRSRFTIRIAVDSGTPGGKLVAQGRVTDIAQGGLRVKTRHHLSPGDHVELAIPTEIVSRSMGLPKAFLAQASVTRVNQLEDDIVEAALRLEGDILGNMEYAMFMDYIRSLSGIMNGA